MSNDIQDYLVEQAALMKIGRTNINFQVSIEEFLSKTPEPPSPAVIKSSVKILKAIGNSNY